MSDTGSRYISADGHLVEPRDLWTKRINKRIRDRAPRVESRPDGDWYAIEGVPPFPVGLEGVAMEDKLKGKVEKFSGYRHEDTRPGAWDPVERLKDQDLDNVQAEIIFPGIIGLNLFQTPDLDFQRECMRIYNDWMHEFNSTAPDRLFGSALLPVKAPIAWVIEEAERVAKKGFRTVMMPTDVPERRYGKYISTYEPLWECLQELGLPVMFHASTTTDHTNQHLSFECGFADQVAKAFIAPGVIAELIFSGAPQKYPELKLVHVEARGGWQASLLGLLDHLWEDHKRWMEPKLEECPSFYFKRNFWVTFESDVTAVLTRHVMNVDHVMWGNDYPHLEGTFPRSKEQVAKIMGDIPEAERNKLVRGNAARLLNLDGR